MIQFKERERSHSKRGKKETHCTNTTTTNAAVAAAAAAAAATTIP